MEETAVALDGGVMKGKLTKRPRLHPPPSATSTSSGDLSSSDLTEEEEDMANCLILLANGPPPITIESFVSRRFADEGKAGFYVYECKTCRKCFPSFQALGGHRASHKKAKIFMSPLDLRRNSPFVPPVIISKGRVHQCSVCGSEFGSGQALGGHMRRHRMIAASERHDLKKERNVLELDLNLPAPSEDEGMGEFRKPAMVFSASPLLGCHY